MIDLKVLEDYPTSKLARALLNELGAPEMPGLSSLLQLAQ
jgi:hypothetical protein